MSLAWRALGLLLALLGLVVGALAATAEIGVAEDLAPARPRDAAPVALRAGRRRPLGPCRRRRARPVPSGVGLASRTARPRPAHRTPDPPPDPDAH
jgi:hypothetical protein